MRRGAEELWRLYRENPQFRVWEEIIADGESSHGERAWNTRFGGYLQPPAYFEDLSRHPRIFEPTEDGKKSSAAGKFQITATTWDSLEYLELPDFGRRSQIIAMMALTERRQALVRVMEGDFATAVVLCPQEWSSLKAMTYFRIEEMKKEYGSTGPSVTDDSQPAAPIEERSVEMSQDDSTNAFDWGSLIKVGGAIAGAFNPLIGVAISALGPIVQQKIEKEVGRHTDEATAKTVAAQLSTAIGDAVTKATGKADPVAAIAKLRSSPTAVAQVEQAVEEKLADMQPLLDAMHKQQMEREAAAEVSRNAAADRVAKAGWNIQKWLVVAGMALMAIIVIAVLALLIIQTVAAPMKEPSAAMLTFAAGFLTTVALAMKEMYAFAFGGVQEGSPAADARLTQARQ